MVNKTDFIILDSLQAIIVSQSIEEKVKLKNIKKILKNTPSKEARDKYLTIKDNNWHKTPIQCAAEQGLWKIFAYLKKKGAVYETDCNGRNLAHHAAYHSNFKLTNEILSANPLLAKQGDNDKLIPIQYAFTYGKVKFISDFQSMAPGLFPNYCNHKTTPLHLAVSDNDEQRVASLVVTLPSLINLLNENGQTSLHLAIQLCHIKIANYLASISDIDKWVRDTNHKTAYDLLLELKSSLQNSSLDHFDELVTRLQPLPFSPTTPRTTDLKNNRKLTASSREISKSMKFISVEENETVSTAQSTNEPTLSSPRILESPIYESYDDLTASNLSSSYSLHSIKSRIYELNFPGEETFRDAAKDNDFTPTPRTPNSSRNKERMGTFGVPEKDKPTANFKEIKSLPIMSTNANLLDNVNSQAPVNTLELRGLPNTPITAFKAGLAKLFKEYMDNGKRLEFDFKDTNEFIQYFSDSPVFSKLDPWRPLQQIAIELRTFALKAFNNFATQQQNIELSLIECLKKNGIGKETELSTLSTLALSVDNHLYNILYLLCRRLSFSSAQNTMIILGLLEEYEALDILTQLANLMPLQSKSEQLINIYMIKELIIWDDRQDIVSCSKFTEILNDKKGLGCYLESYAVLAYLNQLVKTNTELKNSPFEFYRLFTDALQGELSKNLLSIDCIFNIALGVLNHRSSNQSNQEAYALLRSELQKVSLTTFRNACADEFKEKNTSKSERTQQYSPHIQFNRDMTNGLVYYFINKILDCKTNLERSNTICLLISLANDLLNINSDSHENQNLGPDLTTGSAIMAALNHHTVDRLKDTWKLVNSRRFYAETYISLQNTFAYEGNYATLRALQNTSVAPIPFICIFLRDIIYFKDRKYSKSDLKQNDVAKYYEDLGTVFSYLRTLKRNLSCTNNIPRTNLSYQLKILSVIESSVLEIKSQKIAPRVLRLSSSSTPDLIKLITMHCKAGNSLEIVTSEDKKITGLEALNKIHQWIKQLVDNEKIDKKQAKDFMCFLCDFVAASINIGINQSIYLSDFSDKTPEKKSRSISHPVLTQKEAQDRQRDLTKELARLLNQKEPHSTVDCLTYLQETLDKENKNSTSNQTLHNDKCNSSSVTIIEDQTSPQLTRNKSNDSSSKRTTQSNLPSNHKGSIGRQFIISNYRKSKLLSTQTSNTLTRAYPIFESTSQDQNTQKSVQLTRQASFFSFSYPRKTPDITSPFQKEEHSNTNENDNPGTSKLILNIGKSF